MAEIPAAVELMTITAPGGAPTLAEAASQLGVAIGDMDLTFGVVPVDPDRGLYAVQVRAGKHADPPAGSPKDYRGPWSNPVIAPFGPVQGDKKVK